MSFVGRCAPKAHPMMARSWLVVQSLDLPWHSNPCAPAVRHGSDSRLFRSPLRFKRTGQRGNCDVANDRRFLMSSASCKGGGLPGSPSSAEESCCCHSEGSRREAKEAPSRGGSPRFSRLWRSRPASSTSVGYLATGCYTRAVIWGHGHTHTHILVQRRVADHFLTFVLL